MSKVRQKISILLVEDSKLQRKFLKDLCMDISFAEVTEAENGREALAIIDERENYFDILICDLEMPDIDGIELIHLLAGRQVSSALIIASSREAVLIDAVELMATTEGLYVLGTIQKPIRKQDLLALLQLYKGRTESKLSQPSSKLKLGLGHSELVAALQHKQFVLYYQPKVKLPTGELIGVEALVRLQQPDGSIVMPDSFIPQCEKYRLIDLLSYEIIELACQQHQHWLAQGLDTKISVNLSAVSFENDDFSHNVMKLLKKYPSTAKHLVFEVTETAVIGDIGKALAILARLRLAGCGLSIDDYGTGYSSIKQLSQIPFTELKIDRSLISGLSSKPHLKVIFESTLDMCNKLNIQLVAEGIEKEDDWKYLCAAGCHLGQGYYISPAMQEQALLNWWQQGSHFLG